MKYLFNNNGFSYYELPLPLKDKPAEFEQALDLWQSKCVGDKMPSWNEFDFYDFKGLHGWVALSEIRFDPIDVYYRLFGSEFVNLLGVDLTGKRYSETGPNAFHWQDDLDYFLHNSQHQTLGYAKGSFERIGRPATRLSFLDIPLPASMDEPDRITHILTIACLQNNTD